MVKKSWQLISSAAKIGKSKKGAVARGHVAVYAGKDGSRFEVPVSYLAHPVFRCLLDMAENEFGFNQKGGLTIPCEAGLLRNSIDTVRKNLAQSELFLREEFVGVF